MEKNLHNAVSQFWDTGEITATLWTRLLSQNSISLVLKTKLTLGVRNSKGITNIQQIERASSGQTNVIDNGPGKK